MTRSIQYYVDRLSSSEQVVELRYHVSITGKSIYIGKFRALSDDCSNASITAPIILLVGSSAIMIR